MARGPGVMPAPPADVGGYADNPIAVGYADADHDGMSDAWEAAQDLDAATEEDGAADADGEGDPNVEEVLNGTDPHG